MMPPEYFPTWLPIPGKAWRLADLHSGAFYPRPCKEGTSKSFETAEEALDFAKRKGIPIVEAEERRKCQIYA